MKPQIHYVRDTPVQVFDLREEKPRLPPLQWSKHTPRTPADAKGLCLHQAGVKPRVDHTERSRKGDAASTALTALAFPYHVAVGVTASKAPIVVLAHPLVRYLFGGDASNGSYLQFAVLGKFPLSEPKNQHKSKISLELKAAMLVGLQESVRLLGEWSGSAGPWEMLAHRQACTSTAHQGCPGEVIMGLAVGCLEEHPLADLLFPSPETALSSPHSLPWPDEWMQYLPSEKTPVDAPRPDET